MGRAASDLQVPAHIEQMMADTLVPEEIAQFAGLLDALGAESFAAAPPEAAEPLPA
jgi:hypothetical protein